MPLVNCYLLGVFLFLLPSLGRAGLHWDRPEVLQRVQTGEILVSAKKIEGRWHFGGIGRVRAKAEDVMNLVMDFQKLSQFDDFFQKVEWDNETQILSLEYAKMGLRGASRVQVRKKDSSASVSHIHFEIISGTYKGLSAELRLSDSLHEATEMRFEGQHLGHFLSRFDFLSAFAIEGVLRSVATSMRKKIEGNHVSR